MSPSERRPEDGGAAPALPTDEFRRLGHAIVDLAADHLSGVRDRPVFRPMTPEERRALLEQPLPDDGTPPETMLRRFVETILPHPMGNGHPVSSAGSTRRPRR